MQMTTENVMTREEQDSTPLKEEFARMNDAIIDLFGLIDQLANKIQPCLNPMSPDDVNEKPLLGSGPNSVIVDHVQNETSRLVDAGNQLRFLIHRVEL